LKSNRWQINPAPAASLGTSAVGRNWNYLVSLLTSSVQLLRIRDNKLRWVVVGFSVRDKEGFMKHYWVLAVLVVAVMFVVGCGGGTGTPVKDEKGAGPPMPAGSKDPHPLTAGSADTAEKIGHGPGRGPIPEGAKGQGVDGNSGPPIPGGPPR
jgi:hypothetical protein